MMLGGSTDQCRGAADIGSHHHGEQVGRRPDPCEARHLDPDMGVTKMTVVTLSARAETVPVNHEIRAWMSRGRPPARFRRRPTAQGKTSWS